MFSGFLGVCFSYRYDEQVHAPPTPAKFDQIEREARALLGKGVGKRNKSDDWMGFRPT